jgi:uncharacterized membrane protein (DUF485 family)
MKINNINLKLSILPILVFAIFTFGLVFIAFFGPEIMAAQVRSNLYWMIPVLVMLLVIPVALNYMSRTEYDRLIPYYEVEAKNIRIKLINESMIGKIVRIEGVVERTHFQFLNRPQYVVADRSGEISVKMFTSPDEDVKVNDVVEVLGQVIKRYIATGDPVINCVSIRKIDKKIETAAAGKKTGND